MQIEKNKWVEDVLGSADGMERAQSPDMTHRVISGITDTHSSSSMMWRIAASVILLLTLNVSTIFVYNSYHNTAPQGHSEDVASLFGLGADSRQADVGTVFFGN